MSEAAPRPEHPFLPDTSAPTTFEVERHGHVVTVTLARPTRLNAIDSVMRKELAELWAGLRTAEWLRCIVLTGSGRAFSAGADMDGLNAAVRPASTLDALEFLPARVLDVPVVLALNGLCVGGALNFLADADVTIASTEAWLSATHVTMGQVSGAETILLAAKSSSPTVTMLALSGSSMRLSAVDAQRAGLVDEVVDPAEVVPRSMEVAEMIAAQSPTAVRTTVAGLRRRYREPINELLVDTWAAVVEQWQHPDALEGPAAHSQRRAPSWHDAD